MKCNRQCKKSSIRYKISITLIALKQHDWFPYHFLLESACLPSGKINMLVSLQFDVAIVPCCLTGKENVTTLHITKLTQYICHCLIILLYSCSKEAGMQIMRYMKKKVIYSGEL